MSNLSRMATFRHILAVSSVVVASIGILLVGLLLVNSPWMSADTAKHTPFALPSAIDSPSAPSPATSQQDMPLAPHQPVTPVPTRVGALMSAGATAGERREVTMSTGLNIAFRWIPAGDFKMGSDKSEWDWARRAGFSEKWVEAWAADEKPHRVSLTRGFWMAETETTLGQFLVFVSQTGHRTIAEAQGWSFGVDTEITDGRWKETSELTWSAPGFDQSAEHPVVCVAWDDAIAYCSWLSNESGTLITLPTEAQWEYACRAETTSRFVWGDDLRGGVGWLNGCDRSANVILAPLNKSWTNTFPFYDGYVYTAPVGSFSSNGWGLRDMAGNVWEWCADSPREYSSSSSTDPEGPTSETSRVVRGGSWYDYPDDCRSGHRESRGLRTSSIFLGFRIVVLTE